MIWVLRKIDSVFGAVFATAGAMSLSQIQTFIAQYVQRLGGHVDEARLALARTEGSDLAARVPEEAVNTIRDEAALRLQTLEADQQAIAEAGPWEAPFVLLQRLDPDIAQGTLTDFSPALPLEPVAASYMAGGLVIGLLVYELFKLPFALTFARSRNGRRGHHHSGHGLSRR
ncbi:MAG: DUF2937 family protein [Rhodospirillaceae bacterium]